MLHGRERFSEREVIVPGADGTRVVLTFRPAITLRAGNANAVGMRLEK